MDYQQFAIKRRITEQLLLHWNQLRGTRPYPQVSDLVPEYIPDVWQDCFMLEVKGSAERRSYHYIYHGANIRAMLEGGLNASAVMPLMGGLEPLYHEVVTTGRGKLEESSIRTLDNKEIRYRRIFLPLGTAAGVDHIIGGMRYKLFDVDAAE